MIWWLRKILAKSIDITTNIVLGRTKITLAEELKTILCKNQGRLIQYFYLAGEKHRAFKEAVNNGSEKEKIDNLYKELENYLNIELRSACVENFKLAQEILTRDRGRNIIPKPRVGLKVHEYLASEGKQYITTMWGTPPYDCNVRCEVDQNSASTYIHNNGNRYIANDIPDAVANNKYINPRIDIEKVKEYTSIPGKLKHFWYICKNILAKKPVDYAWLRCWESKSATSKELDVRQCYKSTLVIPLTLINNEVTKNFLEVVSEKSAQTNFIHPDEAENQLDKVQRYIYGYFCIDHQDKNYFDDQYDTSIGYFFADILSLYLFVQLTYTKLSLTARRKEC